jgi:hypothetical protein
MNGRHASRRHLSDAPILRTGNGDLSSPAAVGLLQVMPLPWANTMTLVGRPAVAQLHLPTRHHYQIRTQTFRCVRWPRGPWHTAVLRFPQEPNAHRGPTPFERRAAARLTRSPPPAAHMRRRCPSLGCRARSSAHRGRATGERTHVRRRAPMPSIWSPESGSAGSG